MVKVEKVTFNLSVDLKERMLEIKEDMSKSLSALYNEAIREFVERKELERWERASKLASKDSEYLKTTDFGKDSGEIFEY
jgi:predicted transcriptional regulator